MGCGNIGPLGRILRIREAQHSVGDDIAHQSHVLVVEPIRLVVNAVIICERKCNVKVCAGTPA
ncbi:MAG: hypothetical protein C4340_05940 [Armatimonadota bacterium]